MPVMPDPAFAQCEQWANEIVEAVTTSPDQQHAVLRVMRMLTDVQAHVAQQTIDEIGRRLHAVPTSGRITPAAKERKP